jgi:transmembrane sensor
LILNSQAYRQKRISVENQSILKELYPKLVNGKINDQELEWLKAYFNTGQTEEMYALIRVELKLSDEIDTPTSNERDVLARVHERIASEKFGRCKEANRPVVRKLWPRIGIAAAVATIIVSAGIWFLKNETKENPTQQSVYMNDIAPGKIGATLTLASGKKIQLTDAAKGEIAKEAGIMITKSADGQLVYELKGVANEPDKINTLTTSNGETYQLRLPDGSVVFLNAASSLTYSTSLIALGKRRVTLHGEAYFQVAKDKTHPFIVKTKKQEIEVLGTHFNVDSYGDEVVEKTTLVEGRVRMSSAGREAILKPGEQGRLEGRAIRVTEVDTDLAIAWKNGLFVFDDEPLHSVMRRIARWYNVEVTYEGVDQNELYGGSVSRYDHVSKVLRKLELTGGIHFKIEGRNIKVMK